MNRLYKWALGFLAFAFIMGWGAANNTGDVQLFFLAFSLIGVVGTVVLTMVGYIDGR